MKKILYVSGSRAEYGIMKRLLLKLYLDKNVDLSIIATGMHLNKRYGSTYKQIEEDGLPIEQKVNINVEGNDNQAIISSMALGMEKFGEIFSKEKYDCLILLGDRYEILPAAITAAINNIPIIHIHGGEKTLGNYDEFIRHSITKMSRFHIVSTEEYRNRVIQLGENPETVKNIGALGAENASLVKKLTKEELEKVVGNLEKKYFVVLFHPETLTEKSTLEQVKELLKALDNFRDKYEYIFIGSNSDTGSENIEEKIKEYTEKNKFRRFISLKPEEYQSLIKFSEGLIGNSSSGIIEVPSLKVPTINIGNRQLGRVKGESVIDCESTEEDIKQAIEKIIRKEFKEKIKESKNPYFTENTLEKYYDEIINFVNNFEYNVKDFYDLNIKK